MKTLIKKILRLITIFIGVTFLSFVLIHYSNIDPAEAYARRNYVRVTNSQIEEIRKKFGYDKPMAEQYFKYIKRLLKGDMGVSFRTNNPVFKDIKNTLPSTLILVLTSAIWIVLFSICFGTLLALKKNTLFDIIIGFITMIGISLPTFWLGYIFLLYFAVKFPLFKVVDYGTIKSLILPSLTFAIPIASSFIKIIRADLIKELNTDYIIYAKARGIKGFTLLWYVLVNILPPIISLFFQNLGFMLGGSAIIESVFSWLGFGSYFISSILEKDLPAISGCLIVITVLFIFFNSLALLLNKKLNPRII